MCGEGMSAGRLTLWAQLEAAQHKREQGGGCTCGFCVWSVAHVVVMAITEGWPDAVRAAARERESALAYERAVETGKCHCGRPIHVYDDLGMEGFTRGLCLECSTGRCDIAPGSCNETGDAHV